MVRTARSADDMALCCWVLICNARDMASAFPVASATARPRDFDLDQVDANVRAAMADRPPNAQINARKCRRPASPPRPGAPGSAETGTRPGPAPCGPRVREAHRAWP